MVLCLVQKIRSGSQTIVYWLKFSNERRAKNEHARSWSFLLQLFCIRALGVNIPSLSMFGIICNFPSNWSPLPSAVPRDWNHCHSDSGFQSKRL